MPLPPVPDLPRKPRPTEDELLRKHHWHVYARSAGKEATWIRDGLILPQSEALKLVTQEVTRGKR